MTKNTASDGHTQNATNILLGVTVNVWIKNNYFPPPLKCPYFGRVQTGCQVILG